MLRLPPCDHWRQVPMTEPWIAGIDEAGRGPLAGPVTVAAVVLDPERTIVGLGDSKKISAGRRQSLFRTIQEQAADWSIIHVDPAVIDQVNILQATLQGMRQAADALKGLHSRILIDGNRVPDGLHCASEAVIGGDASVAAISAASILAKVSRDALMEEAHARYPEYGFHRHKGYPTPEHLEALEKYGPCSLHRRSFAPVRRCYEQLRLAL